MLGECRPKIGKQPSMEPRSQPRMKRNWRFIPSVGIAAVIAGRSWTHLFMAQSRRCDQVANAGDHPAFLSLMVGSAV